MERLSTMRAVRYVIGAGTFAIALGLSNAQPAAAETCQPVVEGEVPPLFCGSVTDVNGGVANATVEVKDGDSVVAQTSTSICVDPGSVCGNYAIPKDTFTDLLHDGTYNICVNGTCKQVTLDVDDFGDVITIDDELTNSKRVDFSLGAPGEVKDAEPPYDQEGDGTGTPGYWKNHPEAWPAEGVKVGGVLYQGPTIKIAISYMGKVSGDKKYSMFSALIAAKLNTMLPLHNKYDCIAGTLIKADDWMTNHPVGVLPVVKASSDDWQQGAEDWHQKLDDYNNGKLCAPHRD